MKTKNTAKPTTVEQPPTLRTPDAPLPTDIVSRLKAAPSVDDAVRLLVPDNKPKARPTTSYVVNPNCTEPLPKQRGACVLVYVTAARRDGAFTAKEMAEALPQLKSAAYWTRKLAASGHLSEVVANS